MQVIKPTKIERVVRADGTIDTIIHVPQLKMKQRVAENESQKKEPPQEEKK